MTRFFTTIALTIILASSALNIHSYRHSILNKIEQKLKYGLFGKMDKQAQQEDAFWAKELMKGGYVLVFRHAERDKWIDVTMYDALETEIFGGKREGLGLAEQTYFADAVCLNARGKIQGRAMGQMLQDIEFPIGPVFSSPSCRARQTADLVFGGYSGVEKILMHHGPYSEDQLVRISKLERLLKSIKVVSGKNTIISAHNAVLHPDLFDNYDGDLHLKEGGFYVISVNDANLNLRHTFTNFQHFIKHFYPR